jgi:uncharacterized protein
MESQHHDLAHESPEFKDKIHSLKVSDAHFKRLFDQYEEIDKKIYRAENRIEICSEGQEEEMRIERVKLKDQLFTILQA